MNPENKFLKLPLGLNLERNLENKKSPNLEFKLNDLIKIDIDDTAEFFDFLESDNDEL